MGRNPSWKGPPAWPHLKIATVNPGGRAKKLASWLGFGGVLMSFAMSPPPCGFPDRAVAARSHAPRWGAPPKPATISGSAGGRPPPRLASARNQGGTHHAPSTRHRTTIHFRGCSRSHSWGGTPQGGLKTATRYLQRNCTPRSPTVPTSCSQPYESPL